MQLEHGFFFQVSIFPIKVKNFRVLVQPKNDNGDSHSGYANMTTVSQNKTIQETNLSYRGIPNNLGKYMGLNEREHDSLVL